MNDLPLDIQSYFSNHIDVVKRDVSLGSVIWRATGFYGFPATGQMALSWALFCIGCCRCSRFLG